MISLIELVLIALIITNHVAADQHRSFQQQKALSVGEEHYVRPAVNSDLDDIVTVLIDAFSPGDLWQYIMKDQKKFAKYTWNCLRKQLREDFRHLPSDSYINVIAVPNSQSAASYSERVVAFAHWKTIKPKEIISAQDYSRFSGMQCSKRLDINLTRGEDFNRQFMAVMEKHIFGLQETQLYLNLLATHPNWDGHRFGALHCEWGMRYAATHRHPITLIASPAGYPLYESMGFESKENVTIDMLDSHDKLWYEAMRWDA